MLGQLLLKGLRHISNGFDAIMKFGGGKLGSFSMIGRTCLAFGRACQVHICFCLVACKRRRQLSRSSEYPIWSNKRHLANIISGAPHDEHADIPREQSTRTPPVGDTKALPLAHRERRTSDIHEQSRLNVSPSVTFSQASDQRTVQTAVAPRSNRGSI